MELIYLDERGYYVCRLCLWLVPGQNCRHLSPAHREHNRRAASEAKR